MDTKVVTEVHVASRNDKWEVFFPDLDEAMYSCEDKEEAIEWAQTLAKESDYAVVVK